MNLIELFEKKPFQDVGTFNAIFKTTPILGFPANAEVEIKGLVNGGMRRIEVGGTELILDLAPTKNAQKVAEKRAKFTKDKVRCKKTKAELPPIYKQLTASEFMTYYAIKELGSVSGMTELSRHISLTRNTISKCLVKLKKLGWIKTETVAPDTTGGAFLKITIDTATN